MNELVKSLNDNQEELLSFVDQVPEEILYKTPQSGSWSVIQILDHLVTTEFGILGLFNAPGSDAGANRESKMTHMESFIHDRSKKATAPDFLTPKGKTDTKKKFKEVFPKVRQKLIIASEDKDLTQVCDLFPHFVFGKLTFEEWLHFIVGHVNRHMLQMKKVIDELQK